MIVESYLLTATDTDILAAPSRLAAIPYNGQLVMEFQASDNDGTNGYDLTIQLPDGSTPLDGVDVPKGVTDGSWNKNDKYTVAFAVTKGGHVLVQATETGTASLWARFTLMP